MHPLLTALTETVLHQDESIAQSLAWNTPEDFGDPATPATPAFHLHHTVAVFREHARHAIKATHPDITEDQLNAIIPHHEAPIPTGAPWSPKAAADDLTQSLHAFTAHMNNQPDTVCDTPLAHNRPFTLATFINMMTRHITWHAAAIHYRSRPTP